VEWRDLRFACGGMTFHDEQIADRSSGRSPPQGDER
jgi:hypothetical protein